MTKGLSADRGLSVSSCADHKRVVRVDVLVVLAVALLFALPPGLANTSQTVGFGEGKTHVERGYTDGQLYFAIGGAEVNAFNFNLVMSMSEQLGFGMPVDGGLGLSLTRVYNSMISKEMTRLEHRQCNTYQTPTEKTEYLSMSRQNPLGLGWQFHLGRIYQKEDVVCPEKLENLECYPAGGNPDPLFHTAGNWTYVGPDGAEHQLSPHVAESTSEVEVYYTYDGSRIKGKRIRFGSPPDYDWYWELYLSDGRIVELRHEVVGNIIDEASDPWRLVAYEDDGGPDGFCSVSTHVACDNDAECPPGFCIDGHADCWTDGDCAPSQNGCFAVQTCEDGPGPLANRSLAIDNSAQPHHYDRDKVGFHTTLIRGREEDSPDQPTAYIEVEYHLPPFDYIMKTITDSHSTQAGVGVRQIDIGINRTVSSAADYGKIASIDFPAPPNDNNEQKARFEFLYEAVPIALSDGTTPYAANVLTRVNMPQDLAITYRYRARGDDTPEVGHGGELNEIIYPSGKLVKLTYAAYDREWMQRWLDPANSTGDCGCVPSYSADKQFVGLSLKQEYLDGDSANGSPENLREWTFSTTPKLQGPGDGWEVDPFDDLCGAPLGVCKTKSRYWNAISTMVDPANNETRIVYDTSTHDVHAFRSTYIEPHQTAYFGNAIEEHYFKGTPTPEEEGNAELKEVITTWDEKHNDECHGITWAEPTSKTVRYLDDPATDTEVTTEYSDWNDPQGTESYGRYETATTKGNGVGDREKIAVTDYAIDNTGCNAATALYNEWLPNVVANTSVSVKQGGNETPEQLTEYAFNTTTGRTTDTVSRVTPAKLTNSCRPTLTDIAPQDEDVVTSVIRDAAGNVTQQDVHFGAAGSEVFTTHFGYAYGVQTTERSEGLGYYNTYIDEADIDLGTSLVLKEQYNVVYPYAAGDDGSVARVIDYDELRRPVRETIGQMKTWHNTYNTVWLNDAHGGRERLDNIVKHQSGQYERIESVTYYEVGGRVDKRRKLNPDASYSYQYTEYDDFNGKVAWVSEWTDITGCGDPTPLCSTVVTAGTTTDYTIDVTGDGPTSDDYEDPLGRPIRVTGPLNSVESPLNDITDYNYFGTNKTVTVYGIAGPGNPAVVFPNSTTYYTDGLGRLRGVETSDVNGPAADAIYEYDYADRLVKVYLIDSTLSTAQNPLSVDRYAFDIPAGAQDRTFIFDALGRQTSSDHPESGTTTVEAWNALGAPTRVQDALGLHRGHLHETSYDVVGRPISVARVIDGPVFAGKVFSRGDEDWDPYPEDSWAAIDSEGCLENATAWYNGDPATCVYADSGLTTTTLTSKTASAVGPLPKGATLSFEYFREVRDSVGGGTHGDELRVLIKGVSDPTWEEIFTLDSNQISWLRWKRSPAIPIPDTYEGKSILIRFEFNPISPNPSVILEGAGIGEVVVKRPDSVLLTEVDYDDDFAIAGNKSRGKPVEVRSYDESTGLVNFTRRRHYVQTEGRLSKEITDLDWDRSGNVLTFEADYDYNDMGQLEVQTLPYLTTGTEDPRDIEYTYRHGALVGITSHHGTVAQEIVPDSIANPGITYNVAGGIDAVYYGNELTARITPNTAFLPHQITVEPLVGDPLFDTGVYVYDGARNIQAIGADYYGYDAAGRLAQANVTWNDGEAKEMLLNYTYDHLGNMTDREVPQPPGSPQVPAGLEFITRGYNPEKNRIDDTGFEYDENGNMVKQPMIDGQEGFRYEYNSENVMTLARPLEGGEIYQESLYGSDGYRWLKTNPSSSNGGEPLLTLRDAAGNVAAEYVQYSAVGAVTPTKHYIRGNSQLMAIQTICGPPPELGIEPEQSDPDNVALTKTLEAVAMGPFDIHIESADGYSKVLEDWLEWDDADEFTIPVSELFAGNNWIRIRAELDCKLTSYSNAVSYYYETDPEANCLDIMGIAHTDFNKRGQATTIQLNTAGDCDENLLYSVYHVPEGGGSPVYLSGPSSAKTLEIPNTPAGAGHGEYYFRVYDPVTKAFTGFSPRAKNDARNSTDGGGSFLGTSDWRTEFVHADHLGSTRLITDDQGEIVSEFKYYPFGMEVALAGGSDVRMKFTGHERDGELRLDYMKARYCGSELGRFLSVDPGLDVALHNPQRWNLYAYAHNKPIKIVDPDGEAGLLGALVGAAIDLGVQTFVEKKSLREVNWVSVGVSAASGATGVGLGRVVAKNVAKVGGRIALNAAGSAAIGAAGSAATTVGTNAVEGNDLTEGLNGGDVAKAAAVGGALGGLGSAAEEGIVAAGRAVGNAVHSGEVAFKTKPVYARGQTADDIEKAATGLGTGAGVAAGNASPAVTGGEDEEKADSDE